MQKRNLFPTVRAGPRTAVFLCQNCSGVHCGIMCSLDPNVNFIAVFVCVCVCVCVEVFAYLQGSHQAMFGKLGNFR